MRITQCNTVLKFFKPRVLKKYGLIECTDPSLPCVFWGMYAVQSRKLISHQGFAVVVWCGSDAMSALKNRSFVQFLLQNTGRIFHIAISNFIERDLKRAGLPYKALPLLSVETNDCHVMPRGRSLYHYGTKSSETDMKYNYPMAKEVSLKTGLPLIVAHKDSFSRGYLINTVYRECFLGLRLLTHDGLSNSMVELGLCGRNVIHNGNLPNSINFRDIYDIIAAVRYEFAHRREENTQIAIDVKKFINIDENWLNTEYYENNE